MNNNNTETQYEDTIDYDLEQDDFMDFGDAWGTGTYGMVGYGTYAMDDCFDKSKVYINKNVLRLALLTIAIMPLYMNLALVNHVAIYAVLFAVCYKFDIPSKVRIGS